MAEFDSQHAAGPAEECELAPALHITVDQRGYITVETVGTKGSQCDLLAGALEKSLGVVLSRLNKDTYEKE